MELNPQRAMDKITTLWQIWYIYKIIIWISKTFSVNTKLNALQSHKESVRKIAREEIEGFIRLIKHT